MTRTLTYKVITYTSNTFPYLYTTAPGNYTYGQ